MYEFTKIERISPSMRPSNERIKNFHEISEVYSQEEAKSQASRCVQCGNPYCSATGCPLSNFIPQWLKFIAEKDLEQAFRISNETSPFPEILGRICPHDRLCEGACTLNDGNEDHLIGAITIGSIEVAISERGFDQGLKPEFAEKLTEKKVAIIGSGPAGLSCATFLLRAGVKPVIYERADKAGGLLTYGIPGFKLEKEAVERRVQLLLDAGMELHLNTEVGKDITFDELKEQHDAVFIGTGAMQGKVLDHEGYSSNNLFMAVPFLTNVQKKIEESLYDRKYDVKGKSVLVIGGGILLWTVYVPPSERRLHP
ncbi:FAD-dependent oxidoreductase [Limibacter armeniacum]